MKKRINIFSEDFLKFLIDKNREFLSAEKFDALVDIFNVEAKKYHFTLSSENNLRRIIETSFDTISLLNDCLNFPHHSEILIAISASSNFLSDIIVRNPEYLHLVFDQEYLAKKISEDEIKAELLSLSERYKSYESKVKMLRLIKRRYLLRIGLNDILLQNSLRETVEQISVLARSLLGFLFEITHQRTLEKKNIIRTQRKYCLASLGKLGGNELNYSSDVDLILFYDKNGKVGNEKIDYYDLITETTQRFIQEASSFTSTGFLFRIDFRLRPDGRNAPLARTVGDYIRYYETRGEEWERQMLIKLNFLGGSRELYNSFFKYIEHYVYPSTRKTSPLEIIRKMKMNIEEKISGESNIKLFPGGIRDIEFSVQALQLINGGKITEVRTGNTLTGISKLAENKKLTQKEEKIFIEAYIFYRRIEHFLQLLNDTQTHILPTDLEIRKKLAAYLSLCSENELDKKIRLHRKKVRIVFSSIFEIENTGNMKSFDHINFSDEKNGKKGLKFLRTGINISGIKEFDKRTADKFLKFENQLIEFLHNSLDPDLVLKNLITVINSSRLASVWYNEFQNLSFLQKFLTLLEQSQKVVEMLVTNPKLGEQLITRRSFDKDISTSFVTQTIAEIRFILSVQFTLGLVDNQKFSRFLAFSIGEKISKIVKKANIGVEYFIGGMGSFGAAEMGLNSDVDLVFVVEEFIDYEKTQNQFQKILFDLRRELAPFDVDCRLRPEGKKSPLVWDLHSYNNYLERRARIWELQALLKLNFIDGSEKLYKSLIKCYHKQLRKMKIDDAKNEMTNMRRELKKQTLSGIHIFFNIKKSFGGLSDLDFILSILLFEKGKFSVNQKLSETSSKLEFLKSEISINKIESIGINFNYLKNVEFTLQNLFASRNVNLPVEENKLKRLAQVLNFNSAEEFSKKTQSVFRENSEIFNKLLSF